MRSHKGGHRVKSPDRTGVRSLHSGPGLASMMELREAEAYEDLLKPATMSQKYRTSWIRER